jgi:hypothetical protein
MVVVGTLVVSMLYIILGKHGLRDTLSSLRSNTSMTRFGVKQVFAATAILAVLLSALRVLEILHSLIACIVVGVFLLPFATAAVYFVGLIFVDCAELFLGRRKPTANNIGREHDNRWEVREATTDLSRLP